MLSGGGARLRRSLLLLECWWQLRLQCCSGQQYRMGIEYSSEQHQELPVTGAPRSLEVRQAEVAVIPLFTGIFVAVGIDVWLILSQLLHSNKKAAFNQIVFKIVNVFSSVYKRL